MPAWSYDVEKVVNGYLQIIFTRPGGKPTDVTYFRGAPTQLTSYSSGDPFGDAAAVFSFPSITPFDDLTSKDVGAWLSYYAAVEIYWVPMTTTPGDVLSPITQEGLTPNTAAKSRIWEGYVASMDFNAEEKGHSLQIQCQGALYQLDRYLQKPFYPPRPFPLEALIKDAFAHKNKPHLKTKVLKIEWPTGWAKNAPAYDKGGTNIYTPVVKPGNNYSGYSSRQTGGWDHTLTGFVQDQLAVMYTDDDSGVTPGNQWSVRKDNGRQPVLYVRDRFRTPDFEVWLGTPGFEFHVTGDSTQMANIIYGEGTGTDGTVWRNAVVSNDGKRTDYTPLAASKAIYPPIKNKYFDPNEFASEAFLKYGSGFPQDQAISSAVKTLRRDMDPGWSGSAVFKTDPEGVTRWELKAGMCMKVKGFLGTGDVGMNFHIAEVEVSPMDGTVNLKIDTRFRDLLNLEEALVRSRDPLTPSKMLQINKRSVLIEDIMAPWDYTAGSGFVPKASVKLHKNRPPSTVFPWESWLKEHPPKTHGHWYVKVKANASTSRARWTLGSDVPILMSEKGSIRRTEVVAVDSDGNVVTIPFHFSLYYVNVTVTAMPFQGTNFSPFQVGAFESVSPTGMPWPSGNFFAPDPSLIIGWGNHDQMAGFSPGRSSDGFPATGILVDESGWTYDCTNNPDFDKNFKPGQAQDVQAITIYGAFYAEYTEPVYFIARMYKEEQGT